MRPGRIRPGNVCFQLVTALLRQRFNEARADSPGKNCWSWTPASAPLTGFNEARADSPGKCLPLVARLHHVADASMRPGRIRPGNRANVGESFVGPGASMRPGRIRPGNLSGSWYVRRQSNPGFNEARADSPGKCGRQGPGQAGAGRQASMRPGRIRPGNAEGKGPGRRVLVAKLQ